jgi:hypothetical protein
MKKGAVKQILQELHDDPRMEKLVQEIGLDDKSIENLTEFLYSTIKLGRKLSHGMFLATCAAHERLLEATDIQDDVETKVMRWMGKRIKDIVVDTGKKRERFMRKLVLYTRDITQEALGVS